MNYFQYLYTIINDLKSQKAMEDINRIKIVLVEKKRTGKWLAEQLGKDPSTISKWCSNSSQPSLEALTAVAEILNMDRRDLINKSR